MSSPWVRSAAGSECGTDLERLDGQSTLGGVVCSVMHPTVAHTDLIIVLRTNGGYGKGLSNVCPTGTCQGTTGITEEWSGNLEAFCNPDLPAKCEACLEQGACDASSYTDHGDGTVASSCCGLTWMQALLPDPLEYEEAVDACWLSRFAGGGWRLPTLGEARSLLVPTASPMIDLAAFPGSTAQDAIWTTTGSNFFDHRETLSFETGMNNATEPTFGLRARCVR